jgi:[ribosomal protein S5]-alanine N-acetyltransferase
VNCRPLIRAEALTPEHAPQLFGPLSDPELYRYIPGPPPVSAEALAVEFRRLAAGSRDPSKTWLNYVLWHEQSRVGTLQSTLRADATAVIAYLVFRPFWGRSFASEGCRWLLTELFERHGAREAFAYIDERNVASLRVSAALGFTARTPQDPSDVDPGDVLWGLAAEEWRARRT